MLQLKNNAASALAASLAISENVVIVEDGSVFPALTSGNTFPLTLFDADPLSIRSPEIVTVTARSGNALTVTRAQEGTAALAFAAGAKAELRVTAGVHAALQAEARARASHTGTQPINTVEGLQEALDTKTPSGHTHSIGSVTGLQAALNAKQPTLEAGVGIAITGNVVSVFISEIVLGIDAFLGSTDWRTNAGGSPSPAPAPSNGYIDNYIDNYYA